MRYFVLLLLVAGALTPASFAWADPPAAIVMAITGDTDPPLSAMAEIAANTTVQLKPGAKLTFLHYARCKLVTVAGGTLSVSRADYKEDGTVESETDGPCPRVYALSDATGHSAGGLISRGIATAPHWSTKPEIIFTGSRAGDVVAAVIADDGQPGQAPIKLDIDQQRAREPQGAPPLQREGHYRLRLTLRDRPDPIDIAFIAANGLDSLVVLRVD